MGAQDGQSLVIVVLTMVVLIGIGALAIDVSSWYQKHHSAQVAADAAALAAANCLANSSATNTATNMCTTTTDTNAQNVATTIASANGFPTPTVTVGSSAVTVAVSTKAPTYFAGYFKLGPSVSARAVASFTPGTNACTSSAASAGNCYSIFAGGPNATTCTNSTISFGGGGETLDGAVHTNGTISGAGDGGDVFDGPVTYGSTCTAPGTNANYKSSGSPAGEAPVTTWPDDYSNVLPACSSTGQYQCTGPGGTPSYCTTASANVTVPANATTSGIYCATGTVSSTVLASNPATWTGMITISSNEGSSTTPYSATYIGGTISLSNGTAYLSAYQCSKTAVSCTYPLFYLVGTGTMTFGSGGDTFYGAIFCPNGTISLGGGGNSVTFLEAESVSDGGGALTGDGPSATGGVTSPGSDSLSG